MDIEYDYPSNGIEYIQRIFIQDKELRQEYVSLLEKIERQQKLQLEKILKLKKLVKKR